MSRLDMPEMLPRLAQRRPIFHSEADFQHALAWQIHIEHPSAQVRLETRPERGMRLDLLIAIDGHRIAIELKYLVARFEGSVGGEHFDLPNQGAHDISRHDFVKDVMRIERFVESGVADVGWAVALSNDRNYWNPGWKADPIDAAFRLHEGRRLEGTMAWGHLAGAGTTSKRDAPLAVTGSYCCNWLPYSIIPASGGKDVELRFLAFEVAPRAEST